ncbi:MAG: metal ABC transporter permease [Clostridia bacterium]|nr:metal ABC transporter permease [Clostridia bacterium]
MELLTLVFSDSHILRCTAVGILVSLCAALLGVCLVLKRYSMIGDGLSHVAFGALSISFALNLAPLAVTIPVVMITAFVLLRLSDSGKIKGDSAIALIASTSLAAGVAAASLGGGGQIDVNSYMFGSILLVGKEEFLICLPLAIVVLAVFVLCYHDIFLVTYDEDFARASGTNAAAYKTLIALLTALVVVIGMRIMGTLLISSLVIFPALTAMRVFKSFRGVIICAGFTSVFAFLLGLLISFAAELPTGSSIVLADAVIFALFFMVGKVLKRS